MKSRFVIIALLLIAGIANVTRAQQSKIAGPSDTLVVVWSSGDPDVAEKSSQDTIVSKLNNFRHHKSRQKQHSALVVYLLFDDFY